MLEVNAPPCEPVRYQISPYDLPLSAQQALLSTALSECAQQGFRRIALFPAGQQSARLDTSIFESLGLKLVAILDDQQSGTMHGITITHPDADTEHIDAVLIASDRYEHACAHRARQLGLPIFCPYQVLEDPDHETISSVREQARERLRTTFAGKLNLGCGLNPLDGWTNVDGGDNSWYQAPDHRDVIPLDVFDAMAQLPDESCDLIASEHFYEHFTLEDGHKMAREWARLLRPGGIVRVVTPDLTNEAKIYLGDLIPAPAEVYDKHKRRWLNTRHAEASKRFLTPAMLLNFGMSLDGHLFLYDFPTLKAQLESVGLHHVQRLGFGQSEHQELNAIDQHDGDETGGDWAKGIQLVVEATKPIHS